MGIFTRLKDIVGSNINAMLEHAEDPEKLIKLMIQEMEDTLVEIKASCADAIATQRRIEHERDDAEERVTLWMNRAQRALEHGRDDLAREALVEKTRFREKVESLETEAAQAAALVAQYHEEITQLEEKLAAARDKHRMLVRRHAHARSKKQAKAGIRRLETSDAWVRFEQFENRIERMEADADLVDRFRPGSLENRFAQLDGRDDIERELEAMRRSLRERRNPPPVPDAYPATPAAE